MSDRSKAFSRRHFLKGTALGLATLPLAGTVLRAPSARADELPRLEEDDPAAQAVDYVHDAADAADHPDYEEGQLCANCQLYTDENGEWGECSVFPGKLVAAQGWCNVWVPVN
ncbi:MAG: high-potential iron-sulfur protein [Ectothiorhodospiraceae bacterium]|nr:high-potential iron-sulfur protein [Ectothiorhodospiraceae bacterium]